MTQPMATQTVDRLSRKIQEYRDTIERERDQVDFKPYSHNIISLTLQAAANAGGNGLANSLIDEFELEELGWSKQPEDDQ